MKTYACYARVGVLALTVIGLSGCVASGIRKDVDAKSPGVNARIAQPVVPAASERVASPTEVFMPVRKVKSDGGARAWLSKPVALKLDKPTSLTQIVRTLAASGINISSDMPLDDYVYAGTVNSTSADAALKQILGSVGLDYQTDDTRRLVTITPMASRTWYINLGDRRSMYQSQQASGQDSGDGSMSSGGGAAGQGGQNGASAFGGSSGGAMAGGGSPGSFGGGAGGAMAGGMSGTNGSQSGNGNTAGSGQGGAGNSITVTDQFWDSLQRELAARLTILVPRATADAAARGGAMGGNLAVPPLAGMPQQPVIMQYAGSSSSTDGGAYVQRQVGSYSLNPTTGAITVQAPHWVLANLDGYFVQVQAMYNTDITFTGELVTLTSSDQHSEGLDVASFGKFASGRYGAMVSNNALGGVTVSLPGGSNIPSITAGSQPLGGALLGVASKLDGLQIFNAYLQQLGKVYVTQRPVVTTTSGVPGEFIKKDRVYFNLVSQQAASGGVGSAVQATNNTLQSQDYGVELRINPRYDVTTGLIRAQISLVNVIKAGQQTIQQTISVGSGSQSVPQTIPLATQLKYSGEALLRDGDLIIVGGQSEDGLQSDQSGLPGVNQPVGGIFGTKKSTRSAGTYYFALRVSVHPR